MINNDYKTGCHFCFLIRQKGGIILVNKKTLKQAQ